MFTTIIINMFIFLNIVFNLVLVHSTKVKKNKLTCCFAPSIICAISILVFRKFDNNSYFISIFLISISSLSFINSKIYRFIVKDGIDKAKEFTVFLNTISDFSNVNDETKIRKMYFENNPSINAENDKLNKITYIVDVINVLIIIMYILLIK